MLYEDGVALYEGPYMLLSMCDMHYYWVFIQMKCLYVMNVYITTHHLVCHSYCLLHVADSHLVQLLICPFLSTMTFLHHETFLHLSFLMITLALFYMFWNVCMSILSWLMSDIIVAHTPMLALVKFAQKAYYALK